MIMYVLQNKSIYFSSYNYLDGEEIKYPSKKLKHFIVFLISEYDKIKLYNNYISNNRKEGVKMKIAAQLYSVCKHLGTKKDIRETFIKVKQMGYDEVQLSGIGHVDEDKARFIEELIKELEISICVTHMSFEQLETELEALIKYHQQWGCKYIGIGSMPKEYRNKEGYQPFIEWANKIGDRLSKEDMVFVYHNHRFEFQRFEEKTGMDMLIDGFNENVQVLLDTYWVQAGGVDPVELITKLGGKLDIVHFKDYGIVNDEAIFAEVGSGNFNWARIIKACHEAGVKYAAVERDRGDIDGFESLSISRKYLKDVHGL